MSGGAVQDVKVIATEQVERSGAVRTYRTSLEALSGVRLGGTVGAWRTWWEANKQRITREVPRDLR